AGADAQPFSGFGPAHVRLLEGPDASVQVQIGAHPPLSISDLEKSPSGILQEGLRISVEHDTVKIEASENSAELEAPALSAWRMDLPPRSLVKMLVNFAEATLQIEAPAANAAIPANL